MLSKKFKQVPIKDIIIQRDDRQRKELKDIDQLAESIRVNGLIHPILINEDNVLIAGERRLTACTSLGWEKIPSQLATDTSPEELQALELEENVRRSNLSWQEELDAVQRIHGVYKAREPEWTAEKTAAAIGVSPGYVTQRLGIAEEIASGNSKVAEASSFATARNAVERKKQRQAQGALDNLLGNLTKPKDAPAEAEIKSPLLNVDFSEWAKDYKGPKFNFLHCDFPYGIDLQDSEQVGGKAAFNRYEDSEEVYWKLLNALADNWNNLMSPSSSVMFWFSMKFYTETMEFFRKRLPQVELSYMPMIWHKSDNKGILPDPRHGPRQVYETCLIGYTGDRQVVQSCSNAYACPTSKEIHVSEKPIPMLKHFFKMFVDDTTSMLDPTCGSANSLRAADAMGAKRVVGLEIDPEVFTNAERAFKQDRRMRIATQKKE